MRVVRLEHETDFDGWRGQARSLLVDGIPPQDVAWQVGTAQADLFGALERPLDPREPSRRLRVPKQFLSDAKLAICNRDRGRFDLLYRLLWRIQQTPELLANSVDDDVYQFEKLIKSVRRDRHKMRAFVRFRAVKGETDTYVAWFEPEHRIVEENAAFFVRRFANMRWSILTPECSAHWNRETLAFGPGAKRADAPDSDALEEMWRGYYAAIFNPARLKVKAMTSEMPKKYWKNLPEAELIKPLMASAHRVETGMIDAEATPAKRRANYEFAANPPEV